MLSSRVQVDLQASLIQETHGVNPGTKQDTTPEQIINRTRFYSNISGQQKLVYVLVFDSHCVVSQANLDDELGV